MYIACNGQEIKKKKTDMRRGRTSGFIKKQHLNCPLSYIPALWRRIKIHMECGQGKS
jgi:hypothetical protein